MRKKIAGIFFTIFCLVLLVQPVGAAPSTSGAVELPSPEKLVYSMTTYMKSLSQFYISGTASYDKVYQDNDKIQYLMDFDYYVKRPGEFQLNLDGDLQNKQILFNGKSLTIYDEDKAAYATVETPPTIDAALDMAEKEYGLSLALLDVARSDFADALLQDVVKSAYVGKSSVGDIPCHSVAFAKKDRNVQLWIEDGERPFLRKVVITFKSNPAMPSWIVEISDWNLAPVLPEGWSTFVAKPGMKKISFLKPSEKSAAAAK